MDTYVNKAKLQEFATKMNEKQKTIFALKSAVGAPLKAATVSAMTDHDKIYVYTGSESGYTAGHWYYWNGSAWTDGGVYNSAAINTDTTLSVAGQAADAKATGDAIGEVADEYDGLDSAVTALRTDVDGLYSAIYPLFYNAQVKTVFKLGMAGSTVANSLSRINYKASTTNSGELEVTILPCQLRAIGVNTTAYTYDVDTSTSFAVPTGSCLYWNVVSRAIDVSTLGDLAINNQPSKCIILLYNFYYQIYGAFAENYKLTQIGNLNTKIWFSGNFDSYGALRIEKRNANTTSRKITFPTRCFFMDGDGIMHTAVFSDQQEFTLQHSHALVLTTGDSPQIVDVDFNPAVSTNLSPEYPLRTHDNCFVLVYNNSGILQGQLADYYYNNKIADIENLLNSGVEIFFSANYASFGELRYYPARTSNIYNKSNAFVLELPSRMFVVGLSNKLMTFDNIKYNIKDADSSRTNRLRVPHGYIVYYNITDNAYGTIHADDIFSVLNNKDWILLAYNQSGMFLGKLPLQRNEFVKYAQELNTFSNNSLSIVSRQGSFNTLYSPDNTLFGCINAIKNGYDTIRVSVQFTADGVPVCYHDNYINGGNSTGEIYHNGVIVPYIEDGANNLRIKDVFYETLMSEYTVRFHSGDLRADIDYPVLDLDTFLKHSKRLGYKCVLEMKNNFDSDMVPTIENGVFVPNPLLDAVDTLVNKYSLNKQVEITAYPNSRSSSNQVDILKYFTELSPLYSVHLIAYNASFNDALQNRLLTCLTGLNNVYWNIYDNDRANVTIAVRKAVHKKGILIAIGSSYNNTQLYYGTDGTDAYMFVADIVECANTLYPADTVKWLDSFESDFPESERYVNIS